MNNKFGRDERFRGEEFRRDRQAGEPIGRDDDEDRRLRSPDQEFETSGPYRQPYGDYDRSRFDGSYAPSPYGAGATGAEYGRYGVRSRSGREGGGWSSDIRGGYAGRGPKGYTRTDERIREDVCERLSWNDEVDATEIIVRVQDGEVTLEGSVETRHMKRLAEDVTEDVLGVVDVHNTVRVKKAMLTELKEKLTGEAKEAHYANTGTRTMSGDSARNGAL